MSKNLDYVYIKMDFFVKNIKLCKDKKYFPAEILFFQRQKEKGKSSIRWYMRNPAMKTSQKYQNRNDIYIVAKDRFSDNILTFLVLSSIIYL